MSKYEDIEKDIPEFTDLCYDDQFIRAKYFSYDNDEKRLLAKERLTTPYYQFEDKDELDPELELNTDYSQGDDYHGYIMENLVGIEFAKRKEISHKFCLHNFISAEDMKQLNSEFSKNILSRKNCEKSIIKEIFLKPNHKQNFIYLNDDDTYLLVLNGLDVYSLKIKLMKCSEKLKFRLLRFNKFTSSGFFISTLLNDYLFIFSTDFDNLWHFNLYNNHEGIVEIYNTYAGLTYGGFDLVENVWSNYFDSNNYDEKLFHWLYALSIGLTTTQIITNFFWGTMHLECIRFILNLLFKIAMDRQRIYAIEDNIKFFHE